ncbi:conserved hypothetical protein [Frankia sp. Hr75.2]|nr:conserved hypothetical protein [Frankia sp. Hr75.2]
MRAVDQDCMTAHVRDGTDRPELCLPI